MATQREKVIYEGDARGAVRAAQDVNDSFDKMLGQFKRLAGAAGVGLVVTGLVRVGSEMVQLAVDAEESASAFDTTFGPAVARLTDEVEDFANVAGLTSAEMQQVLTNAGAVAVGLGATQEEAAALSEQVIRLAADLTSFRNVEGGTTQTTQALTTALTGERESLKTLGIVIGEAEVQQRALRDTNKDSATELTRLEKAQATLNLAYERAGPAVGDLERTQDSAATQSRKLAAEFREMQIEVGQKLIPVFETLIEVGGELLPIVGEIAGEVAEFVGELTPLLRLLTDLVEMVGALDTGLGEGNKRFPEWVRNLQESQGPTAALDRALAFVIIDLGLFETEIIHVTEEQRRLSFENRQTERTLQDSIPTLSTVRDVQAEWNERLVAGGIAARRARDRYANLNQEFRGMAQFTFDAVENLRALTAEIRAQTDPIFAAVKAIGDYEEAQETATGDPTVENVADATEAWLTLQEALKGVAEDADFETLERTISEAMQIPLSEAIDLVADLAGELRGLSTDTHNITLRFLAEGPGLAIGQRFGLLDGPRGSSPTASQLATRREVRFGGGAQEGMIVPGPVGAPVLVLAHGGEPIISNQGTIGGRPAGDVLGGRSQPTGDVEINFDVMVNVQGNIDFSEPLAARRVGDQIARELERQVRERRVGLFNDILATRI